MSPPWHRASGAASSAFCWPFNPQPSPSPVPQGSLMNCGCGAWSLLSPIPGPGVSCPPSQGLAHMWGCMKPTEQGRGQLYTPKGSHWGVVLSHLPLQPPCPQSSGPAACPSRSWPLPKRPGPRALPHFLAETPSSEVFAADAPRRPRVPCSVRQHRQHAFLGDRRREQQGPHPHVLNRADGCLAAKLVRRRAGAGPAVRPHTGEPLSR